VAPAREDDAADRGSGRRIVVTGEAESQLADAAEIWAAWASSL
jgi:hypothetical protein